MPVVLRPPERLWECPSCGRRHRSQEARVHVPVHACPAMKGLTVPFTAADRFGITAPARHRAIEREDYTNGDMVQTDAEGTPVMAVHTEHPDGSHDTRVYAPTATATGGNHG